MLDLDLDGGPLPSEGQSDPVRNERGERLLGAVCFDSIGDREKEEADRAADRVRDRPLAVAFGLGNLTPEVLEGQLADTAVEAVENVTVHRDSTGYTVYSVFYREAE